MQSITVIVLPASSATPINSAISRIRSALTHTHTHTHTQLRVGRKVQTPPLPPPSPIPKAKAVSLAAYIGGSTRRDWPLSQHADKGRLLFHSEQVYVISPSSQINPRDIKKYVTVIYKPSPASHVWPFAVTNQLTARIVLGFH